MARVKLESYVPRRKNGALRRLDNLAYLSRLWRDDERTRTADLISLRVGLWLSQGVPPRVGTGLTEAERSAAVASPLPPCIDAYQPGCSTIAVNEPGRASPLTRPSQEPHREGTTCGYRGRQGVESRCQRGQVVGRRGKDTFCADPQGSGYEDPHSEYRQQKRQAR
jgi:hypothetical protein